VRAIRGATLAVAAAAALAMAAAGPASAPAAAASDPLCLGSYGNARPRPGAPIRFGVDPGLAGSVGGAQLPSVPDNLASDLKATRELRPPGHPLVVRLNRLFWSDGDAGIALFRRRVRAYTRAGFDVEIQVRYHPAAGQVGNLAAWEQYVRAVVDKLGANRRVIAMTITNEVNLTFSPNTSDGYYRGARDALIGGIETAHSEAQRRGFRWLKFGFTFAYRFLPTEDTGFFSYLGARGDAAFRRALSFVGLDFYPGTVYPPVMLPGDSYRAEASQALGSMRDCFMPLAGIGAGTPIWITENGVPTGLLSDAQQAAALRELVVAVHDYSGTFGVSDYRWFNLRDSVVGGLAPLVGLTFSSDGLLRSDYTPKQSFSTYRSLIAALGARSKKPTHHRR
jgi:hypothetical protein